MAGLRPVRGNIKCPLARALRMAFMALGGGALPPAGVRAPSAPGKTVFSSWRFY